MTPGRSACLSGRGTAPLRVAGGAAQQNVAPAPPSAGRPRRPPAAPLVPVGQRLAAAAGDAGPTFESA